MTRSLLRGLSILLSVALALAGCGGGGGGGGFVPPPPPDPLHSSVTATPRFGTPADGIGEVNVAVVVADAAGNPLPDRVVQLRVTGLGNLLAQTPATDALGATAGTLRSTVGEKKTITAVVDPGPNEVRLGPVTAEFLRILPDWFFVRTSGSDANSGRTPLEAWRTIGHALTQVGPGATVFVGAGTYAEALQITTLASAGAPLEIRGDRRGEFTGDEGEVLIDAGAAALGIELAGAQHVILRGLSVRNALPGSGVGGGIRVALAANCSLLDCRVYENDRGIAIVNSSAVLLEDNRVTGNFGEGLRISGGSGVNVLHNLVYGNQGDGVLLASTTADLRLELNSLYRNGGDQVREVSAGSTGQIANNVFSEGTGMGLALAAGSSLAQTHNLSWAQAGNDPLPRVEADPLFLDPFGPDGILGGVGAEDDDFRVELTSPVLDQGLGNARDLVLALRGALGALTSRADSLPDGTPADLAPVNLGFHYPIPQDPFASLAPLGVRVAFGLSDDVWLRTRSWDRSATAWSPALRTLALNAEVRWLVQRVSPLLQPEEIVAVLTDTGTSTQLFVRAWDGRRWSDDVPAVTTTAIPVANADERGFDVEYEALSGEALLAYVDGADNVLFRTRTDGAWSAAAPAFAPPLATGTLLWVELVPRTGSDEIALVVLDDEQKLCATVWDGAQWTLPLLLDDRVNALHDWKAFDAAWEAQSGDLLVSHGYNLFVEETRYATLKNGVWLTGQHNSTDALGLMVSLAADPTSDRIAAIYGEGDVDDDIGVSVWDGTQWVHTAEFALQGQPLSRAFEVAWLGTTGKAVAIYRDQSLTGSFQWALFTATGWKRQGEIAFPGVGKVVQAEARVLSGENRILLLLLDEAGSLFACAYDGTAWTLKNGGAPLATGLDPTTKGRSFDLDLRGM